MTLQESTSLDCNPDKTQSTVSKDQATIVQATQDEILRLSGRMSQFDGNPYRRETGSGRAKNPRY